MNIITRNKEKSFEGSKIVFSSKFFPISVNSA